MSSARWSYIVIASSLWPVLASYLTVAERNNTVHLPGNLLPDGDFAVAVMLGHQYCVSKCS